MDEPRQAGKGNGSRGGKEWHCFPIVPVLVNSSGRSLNYRTFPIQSRSEPIIIEAPLDMSGHVSQPTIRLRWRWPEGWGSSDGQLGETTNGSFGYQLRRALDTVLGSAFRTEWTIPYGVRRTEYGCRDQHGRNVQYHNIPYYCSFGFSPLVPMQRWQDSVR